MNFSTRVSSISLIAFTVAVATGNCTQNIPAIDMGGSGGTGSVDVVTTGLSVSGSTDATATVGAGACPVTPAGNVVSLTSSTSTGVGAIHCAFEGKDEANNDYLASCTIEGCDCQMDGASVCKCQNAAPTDCSKGCCPSPWTDAP